VPIALSDRCLGLLKTACGVGSLRLPVLPAREVFLEQQAGPAIVAVREQHAAVKLIEIGRCHGRLQGWLPDRKQASHQRLSFFNQRGRLIGLAACKRTFSFPIQGSQLLDGLAVPSFLGGVARGRGRRLASDEQSGGQKSEEAH